MRWALHRISHWDTARLLNPQEDLWISAPGSIFLPHLGTRQSRLRLRLPPLSFLGRRAGSFWETPAETALCLVS